MPPSRRPWPQPETLDRIPVSVRQLWWVWPPLVGGLSLVGFAVIDLADDFFITGMLVLGPLFAFLAALIGTRVPGNPISWLMLVVALAVPVGSATYPLIPVDPPQEVTFWLALGVSYIEFSWVLFIFPVLLMLYVFPTGRFLTPRWQWAGWLTAGMVGTMAFLAMFSEQLSSTDRGWSVATPFGFIPEAALDGAFGPVWGALLAILALGGLAAMIVRYRRSGLEERTQLKWVVFSASAFAVFYAASVVTSDYFASNNFFSVGFAVTFALLPVSMTVAITKYRLYEIDRIVSRSVLYLLVLGLMAGVYVLSVLTLGLFLPAEGDLQVALATLAAAAVSIPAGRRLRRWLDRRFFRSRYDAASVVASFAAELRSTVDRVELVARAESVVGETFQAETVDVWLEEGPA